MNKDTRVVRMTAVLLFVVFCVVACGGGKSNIPSKNGYPLQSREQAVIDAVLKNESDAFLEDGDTMLFDGILPVLASEVSAEYDKNEVSADQKYFKKSLLVTGRVLSVNSGLGNKPYVVLRASNQLLGPQIHFEKKNNISRIASLEKGERASFVCVAGGAIVGTPMFEECSFADDYAAKKVAETKSQVIAYLSGKNIKSESVKKLAIVAIALARVLPDSSTCFSTGKIRAEELEAIGDEALKREISSVSLELRSHGVDVPDLKASN
ncbi:hypothetical protein [Chlorobium sp. N1]|uniref:OB-fold protein n=1 Tax=Chlorobium sp. N1 TaxID=2491138 RepID=UPI0010387C8A|nr:hypothetical protein [Chlorobium sp. N1]TCD47131.1 hypothetical protein E0L29_09465 [Chlorobium sp. N1]